jgi:c(7)-type cytochrome triheme protein
MMSSRSTRWLSWGALLTASLALVWTACYAAEYGDVIFKRKVEGLDDIPPGVFPHWVHRMQFKCSACHDEPFKMEAGANEVTMDAIGEGKSCGVCHDGKKAFASSVDTCLRCHYK